MKIVEQLRSMRDKAFLFHEIIQIHGLPTRYNPYSQHSWLNLSWRLYAALNL